MPSAQSLEKQKQKVKKIADIFANDGVYIFDYRGLSVPEMEVLRKKIRGINADLKVIKNRLAIKLFEQGEVKHGREVFQGPTAVAFTGENYTELAKIIVDFEKESEKIKIKSGFIEKKLVDGEIVRQVAKLPGRDQLLAQLAFTMAMPLKKLARTLASPLTNMVILLNNLKDKKEKENNNG